MVSLFKSAHTDVNYRSHTEIDVISQDEKEEKKKKRIRVVSLLTVG